MKIRDGDWELFDYDPQTGRSVWRYFNGAETVFRTDYPVDNIIKDNREAQKELSGQRWGDGQRIASIPLNVYYDQLAEAAKQDDEKYLSKWLNDSDNAGFRVKEGRV